MTNNNYTMRSGFFQSIVGSFSQPLMFKNFRKQKLTSSISFLALLLLIVAFALTVRLVINISNVMDVLHKFYKENLPPIKIEKGEVKVDAKMPIIIKDEKELGEMVLIIDTTGKITNLDDYKRGILLKKHKVINKKNAFDIDTTDLSNIKNFELTAEKLLKWKKNLTVDFFPVFLLVIYIYKVISLGVQVLIFSFIIRSLAQQKQMILSLSESANIAIYAAVPPILIFTALDVAGVEKFIPGLLMVIAYYAAYYYFTSRAMGAIQPEQHANEELKKIKNSEKKENLNNR